MTTDLEIDRLRMGTELHLRVYVENRGDDKWAVTNGSACFNTDGQWESEPMPSNRDAAFLARTRFDFPKATALAPVAFASLKAAMAGSAA